MDRGRRFRAPGGVRLIRVSDRASHLAYPAASAVERLDTKTYPACPGPPSAGPFTTHGVYVEPGNGPVYKLFVVGHGARESIEVFQVDTAPAIPAITWIGCAIAPDPIGLNSVRGLADGGFITTNLLSRGGTPEATQRMLDGERNGELWEWHTATGWQKVPGSEAAGANGSRSRTTARRCTSRPGAANRSSGCRAARRRRSAMRFRSVSASTTSIGRATARWTQWVKPTELESGEDRPEHTRGSRGRHQTDTPEFGGGTAVAEVGDTLWAGSFRGNRIEIVRVPPPL